MTKRTFYLHLRVRTRILCIFVMKKGTMIETFYLSQVQIVYMSYEPVKQK